MFYISKLSNYLLLPLLYLIHLIQLSNYNSGVFQRLAVGWPRAPRAHFLALWRFFRFKIFYTRDTVGYSIEWLKRTNGRNQCHCDSVTGGSPEHPATPLTVGRSPGTLLSYSYPRWLTYTQTFHTPFFSQRIWRSVKLVENLLKEILIALLLLSLFLRNYVST